MTKKLVVSLDHDSLTGSHAYLLEEESGFRYLGSTHGEPPPDENSIIGRLTDVLGIEIQVVKVVPT